MNEQRKEHRKTILFLKKAKKKKKDGKERCSEINLLKTEIGRRKMRKEKSGRKKSFGKKV